MKSIRILLALGLVSLFATAPVRAGDGQAKEGCAEKCSKDSCEKGKDGDCGDKKDGCCKDEADKAEDKDKPKK